MFVSAGDLEKYAYCPLSWWLSKQHKIVSKEGVRKHRKVEEDLVEIKKEETKAKSYEKFILFFSISASIIAIAGIAFLYAQLEKIWQYFFIIISLLWLLNSSFFLYKASKAIDIVKARYEKMILISSMGALLIAIFILFFASPKNPSLSRFFEILALLWIIIANLLFYRSINVYENIIIKKSKYVPVDSEIVYIGRNRKGEEISSEKYGIRGTPDYIIKINEDYIPIEEKTSNLKSPPFHHVIQLTAYCMLVEDKYKKTPPYGILRYKEKEFKVPYEERWKKKTLELKENILRDIEKEEAHRNHDNKKKCENCLRREFCPERLF